MKVSSGKWRGRSLLSPQGQNVRPTAGLVKEALMDMLGARLPGASVLELFCGTGQLGIEALSRGARRLRLCGFLSRQLRPYRQKPCPAGAGGRGAAMRLAVRRILLKRAGPPL